jgi:hypothetical protein
VWQEETLETYVSLVWDHGCEEPWLLISDEGAGRRQVQVYAWRMRVEATFQDGKSRGWNIEASWIEDRTHLDRLLLALFLAMWWVSHLAAACIHHRQRQRGCLAWIGATRVSFGSDGSGSWISCAGSTIEPP